MKEDSTFIYIIIGLMSMIFIAPLIHNVWLFFWVRSLCEYYTDYDVDQICSYRKRYLHKGNVKRIKMDEYLKNKHKNFDAKEKYWEYLRQNRV